MQISLKLAALIMAGMLLAACAPAPPPEPLELTIVMDEYSYEPNVIAAQVGQQVILHLVNEGALDHELMIGREVAREGGIPMGYHVDLFETAGVEPEVMMPDMDMEMDHGEEEMEHLGTMVLVPITNREATMTFTITADMIGEWEMGCFELEGVHYTAGMVGTFTVTG